MKKILSLILLLSASISFAQTSGDYLVKVGTSTGLQTLAKVVAGAGRVENVAGNWVRVRVTNEAANKNPQKILDLLNKTPGVIHAQRNFRLKLIEPYQAQTEKIRRFLLGKNAVDAGPKPGPSLMEYFFSKGDRTGVIPDPDFPVMPSALVSDSKTDPLFKDQWGMKSIDVEGAWKVTRGSRKIIVAVIDTGVDYTHEDLAANIWHNPGEIPDNGIDDDHNGYIDDVVGWDFAENDNKPFDIATAPFRTLIGGNPGHGTHCAGTIGAVGGNGIGISGINQEVSIMVLRFLTEHGQGTTADAVKAIYYAVNNGARVLSNSWGSEGEDPDNKSNLALIDAINYAGAHNVLFVAAAGNGHMGVGYDNDDDMKPGTPASYMIPNSMSIAAIDVNNQLGKFSNWGWKSVQMGAPGVDILSTMVGNHYDHQVMHIKGMEKLLKKITWDGTSMATPYVAGAAALVLSVHPEYTALELKDALMRAVDKIPDLAGKTITGGKLNVAKAVR